MSLRVEQYALLLNQSDHLIDLFENRWVWTYDHHSIWVGTWIGELNRKFYYLFLIIFLTELILGLILSYRSLNRDVQYPALVVLWLILSSIGIMFIVPFVLYFTIFQTYLALFNFTSVEVFQSDKFREKHSALIPEPYRSDVCYYFINSPFGRGFWGNIYDYFWKWR